MQDELLNLTKQFISIPSETQNLESNKKVLQLIKHELKDFDCSEFVSNSITSLLFSNTDIQQRHFKLLLNAHIDVAPAETQAFDPVIKDGKLYGRGAIDMKSAAAAMVMVFKKIAKQVSYPLGLQIVTDEEVGGENGTKKQLDQGIRAEFVLGGEYSGLRINNEAKGVYYIKLQATGKAAHSAYPWNGQNASMLIMQSIQKIHEILPVPEKEAWVSTASVIKIETDNPTVNTIPHTCSAYINIRYIPEEKKNILKEIQNILPENVLLETLFDVPPEYTAEDNDFVQKLKTAIEERMGESIGFVKTHGQSDLRYFHLLGIPAVNFSPIGANPHGTDEWVDMQSLEKYLQILEAFLLYIAA